MMKRKNGCEYDNHVVLCVVLLLQNSNCHGYWLIKLGQT